MPYRFVIVKPTFLEQNETFDEIILLLAIKPIEGQGVPIDIGDKFS